MRDHVPDVAGGDGQVEAVDRCGLDLDQDLAAGGHGNRQVLDGGWESRAVMANAFMAVSISVVVVRMSCETGFLVGSEARFLVGSEGLCRYESSLRICGRTSVPSSSMARRYVLCGLPPTSICRIWRV